MRTTPVDILFLGIVGGLGGASILMRELAVRMTARGLRVKIVVPAVPTTVTFSEECQARGVMVERTSLLCYSGNRFERILKALRLVHRYRAGVVHYHLSTNTLPRALGVAHDILRPPRIFITFHSAKDDPAPEDPMARRWSDVARRRVARVVAVSERGRQRQLAYGVPAERLQLIYNGVDIERFASGDPKVARRAIGVSPETPLVLFSSRLDPQKRPMDAVHAFATVAAEFHRANLVFVGAGRLEAELHAGAARSGLASRIHFAGYRHNIQDWLAAATVWLLPTETEGFSIAVLEALAAGCPVVTTDCPGNDELLVDGRDALLAPVGNVAALADGLRRVLSDPSVRQRLVQGGRQTATRFGFDVVVDQHLSCYASADRDAPA